MEQKKFDYNSFIGMILLGGIMLWYFNTNKPEVTEEVKTPEVVETAVTNQVDTKVATPTFANDSLKQVAFQNKLGAFAQSAINGAEGTTTIENELVKLSIDNKGGQIVEALIKNYKTHDSLPLYMIKDNNSSFNINFGTTDNRILNTKDLFFSPSLTKNGENTVLSMKLNVSDSQFLEYRYEIKPNNYMVDFSVRSQGLSNVINSSNPINLDWTLNGYRHEKSIRTENTMYSYFYYKTEDEVDYLNAGNTEIVNDVDWVAYKQHFFTSNLLTDTPFNNATVTSTDLVEDEKIDTIFTKKYQLNSLPRLFSIDLPQDLATAIMKAKNAEARRQVGIEWCIMQSQELKEKGAPCLHYYTMGDANTIKTVVSAVS